MVVTLDLLESDLGWYLAGLGVKSLMCPQLGEKTCTNPAT
jgi:hypothetical protein